MNIYKCVCARIFNVTVIYIYVLYNVQVLREGGSAIDAALAVQTVLSVVEPQNSGFGGGSYILYLPANAVDIIAIDGREEAP